MTGRPEGNDIGPDPVRELPGPDPFWLTLLATLSALVIPAATAIGAVLLLGPPNIPHTSKLATIAADALTLAEAVFAGLVAAALVEADWPALSRREALAELRAMAGAGLDPDAVETLIEVEAPSRRVAAVGLLGLLGSALSRLFRRGRHIARTSVTPAAAGATVLAMAIAGVLGVLPAWRGTRVLALRYPAPSVVVQTTPSPTPPDDATSPPASPAPSQAAPSP